MQMIPQNLCDFNPTLTLLLVEYIDEIAPVLTDTVNAVSLSAGSVSDMPKWAIGKPLLKKASLIPTSSKNPHLCKLIF